jgi:D-arabinitol dehydrogenase (NADP+)
MSGTMKAAYIDKPGSVIIRDTPIPEPGQMDVVIEVKYSGICGTDIHIYRGDYVGNYPIIPGHEFSGVVTAVGSSVTRFAVGDHVAVEPNIACDDCPTCLENRQNFCENWIAVGVLVPGGMAQYVSAPEKAVFSIGTLPFKSGAFVEPLSCVLHGVERCGFRIGDRVLIIGAGPIGNLLCQSIKAAGASTIIQIDRNTARLELAARSGATETSESLDDIPHDAFDVVVDATGIPALMARTVDFVRYGGKILLFGVPPQDGRLDIPAFPIFRKGLTIVSSFTSVRNSLQAIRMLETGTIDVSKLVSHELPLEEFASGMEMIEKGKDGALKVLITPNG